MNELEIQQARLNRILKKDFGDCILIKSAANIKDISKLC